MPQILLCIERKYTFGAFSLASECYAVLIHLFILKCVIDYIVNLKVHINHCYYVSTVRYIVKNIHLKISEESVHVDIMWHICSE